MLQRRAASPDDPPQVLAAGVGPLEPPQDDEIEVPDDHDHAEVAWRLRHSRRSVLKEATDQVDFGGHDLGQPEAVLAGLGWAVEGSARLASALLPDLDVNGQFNLLTSTSFDRPQDLFSAYGQLPRGVAFLSLVAPGDGGEWRMRGTMTQGDLSSWIVSGSFVRKTEAAHAYEAGVSYAMQRYLGGNAEALVALRDGSRNVGTLYAYDNWKVSPRLQLTYGARYADYDYLDDERLFSPRAGIVLQPLPTDPTFRVRASASRSETAPGAVEFLPPVAGVWLPPERTFSSLENGRLVPQRVDYAEAGVEQDVGTADHRCACVQTAGDRSGGRRVRVADRVHVVENRSLPCRIGRRFRCNGLGDVGRVRRGRPHAGVGGLPAGVGRVAAESAPVGGAGVGARRGLPPGRSRAQPVGPG